MSDLDNLRDRIADLLWRTEEKSWEDQAQAIIDEFGLQVLEVDRIDLINGTVASYQIVGKWEPECHH